MCDSKRIAKFLMIIILIAAATSQTSGLQIVRTSAAEIPQPFTAGWQFTGQWQERNGDLVSLGGGSATYNGSCDQEPQTIFFILKNLTGALDIHINSNGANYYNIRLANNQNGTASTTLTRAIEETFFLVNGQNFDLFPTTEYNVTIVSKAGHIQVDIERQVSIEFSGTWNVINYSDPNPLPPGEISFRTTEGSHARLGSVGIKCSVMSLLDEAPPNLGPISYKRPKKEDLINTTWGWVPANQVNVVVENSDNPAQAAEAIARSLGGKVTGSFPFINLYQIEVNNSTTEVQLNRILQQAQQSVSVALAFPTQQVFPEASPLDNKIYAEGRRAGYDLVKVQEAWKIIEQVPFALKKVRVGVTDDGLYREYGSFKGQTLINDSVPCANLKSVRHPFEKVGSHGTGVMNIIAADPGNDQNVVGIASKALGRNLSVTMINIFPDNLSWNWDCYSGLREEIMSGCRILSCSWGNSYSHPENVKAFYIFLQKMLEIDSKYLFVFSAGNEKKKGRGSERFPNGYPGGHSLGNVITVGNIWNDGTKEQNCNTQDADKKNFEVTLAAPGQQAVWGYCPDGETITDTNGGSSMATAHVSAAAALIRAVNPCLNASQIKNILVDKSSNSTPRGPAPKDLGGCILSIDTALDEAIRLRGLVPCSEEKKIKDVPIPSDNGKKDNPNVETSTPENEPLKVVSFVFIPSIVCAGETTEMRWSTTGAIGVTITPGFPKLEPSGYRILTPKMSMGYTISAWNNTTQTKKETKLLQLEQCIVPGATSSTEWGDLILDLIKEAHDHGVWQVGPRDVIFRFGERAENDPRGSALWRDNLLMSDNSVGDNVIQVRPQDNGYISGTYSYMNYVVQEGDRISGKIGFAKGSSGANAAFSIHLIEGTVDRLIYERTLSYDDGPQTFERSLDEYSGWEPSISLRVESNGPSDDDLAVWQDVKITGNLHRAGKVTAKKPETSTMSPTTPSIFDNRDHNTNWGTDPAMEKTLDWLRS